MNRSTKYFLAKQKVENKVMKKQPGKNNTCYDVSKKVFAKIPIKKKKKTQTQTTLFRTEPLKPKI